VPGGTRVIVLSKPPRHGACKARLAETLGAGPAARLARAFLADTWATVSAWVSGQPELELVLAQSGPPDEYPLLLPLPATVRQAEGDLGRRMATLVAGALGQRSRVLLLGSDSPGLPETHLAAAVAALDGADLVLGPHRDGGFWCLGVRGGPPALWGNTWLDDLDWETDATLRQVEARAQRIGLVVARAPEWFDVDRERDLPRLREALGADPERAPETLAALARHDAAAGREPFSIVVAALNENIRLDACLEALRQQQGPLEIVVADGGSSDNSAGRAAATAGVTVVVSGPGRGRQFAAGARMATGHAFMFLHADARLPPDGTRLARAALEQDGCEAGAFVTHTLPDPRLPNLAGPLLRLADIRSRITRHPYGDQALFVTRAAYEAVGGFRPLPIMEDFDLSLRLAARAPLARVRPAVRVSGRRIQARPLRAMFMLRLIPPLYRLGVDPVLLARMYKGRG
jgi:rSAM/selenodomain-associated transferase 2/rSAM/selenodomain-associated transferase 1